MPLKSINQKCEYERAMNLILYSLAGLLSVTVEYTECVSAEG